MAAEDVDAVRSVYDGWARGDWNTGVDLFAEDLYATTFDADGDEIECHSRAELAGWLRGFLKQWENIRQEAEEIVDCGDRVYAVARQYGTGRASGVELVMPVYNVWVLRGGQVVEFHTTRHEGVARRKAGLNVR
jgi:ketosteroid isomerase-like protein